MPKLTLQILEGLERGKIYSQLPLPVTIGREDDNTIRLNDDRISRFHVKIQESSGRMILTDLDSTNGTRVNGFPVNIHVLQPGDYIAVGRCLLVAGSQEEILAAHSAAFHSPDPQPNEAIADPSDDHTQAEPLPILFQRGFPEIPENMHALQVAQLSDLLAYIHAHLSVVVNYACDNQQTIEGDEETHSVSPPSVSVQKTAWLLMLKLEMDLAKALRRLSRGDE